MFFSDFARRPIDENNPHGLNPNGTDDFDEMKRQINNLNKVTGRVSWKSVQVLSKKILSHYGKDFRCSCYYTVAALNNDGLKGFVEGLNSLLDLCIVYWFSAYPEHSKPNARIGAIEWMVEYSEKRLAKLKTSDDELPLIEAAHQICLRIEEELRLHYGIKAPSLGGMRRTLKQWIEEIKERQQKAQAVEKAREIRSAQNAAIQSTPEIRVDITPPGPTAKVEPKQAETKSNTLVFAAFIGLLILAFASHFIHDNYQRSNLEQRVSIATPEQLLDIVGSLSHENKSYAKPLRLITLGRLDALMKDWTFDPIKVSKAKQLDALSLALTELYPDSSSALQLRQDFVTQRRWLEKEFNNIYSKFTVARSVFANIAKNGKSSEVKSAYQYSNSLFPLLGRIEYTEKHMQEKEFKRSLRLLNAYLYKLNQLQAETTPNNG